MNFYGKRTVACVLCATLTGAELYLHHRVCAAPIQCQPVDLFHSPMQEPGSQAGYRYVVASTTGVISSGSLDQAMFWPGRPPSS